MQLAIYPPWFCQCSSSFRSRCKYSWQPKLTLLLSAGPLKLGESYPTRLWNCYAAARGIFCFRPSSSPSMSAGGFIVAIARIYPNFGKPGTSSATVVYTWSFHGRRWESFQRRLPSMRLRAAIGSAENLIGRGFCEQVVAVFTIGLLLISLF